MNALLLAITSYAISGTIDVRTNVKDAEILLRDNAQSKPIGKGQATLKTSNDLAGKFIEVRSPAHSSAVIPLHEIRDRDYFFDIELRPLATSSDERSKVMAKQMASDVVDEILSIQELIAKKEFARATPILNKLISQYPAMHAVKLLKANLLLSTGKFRQATQEYRAILKDLPEGRPQIRESVERTLKQVEEQ